MSRLKPLTVRADAAECREWVRAALADPRLASEPREILEQVDRVLKRVDRALRRRR